MDQQSHRQTLQEFISQWETVLSLQQHQPLVSSPSAWRLPQGTTGDDVGDDVPQMDKKDVVDDDPFDCRSLRVPPTHVLADAVADEFVEKWRALDQRKIVTDTGSGRNGGNLKSDEHDVDSETNGSDVDENAMERTFKRQKISDEPQVLSLLSLPRWYEKHVRLPEQFDYTSTKRADDPPSLHDPTDRDRVISLHDPTLTTSYHAELWHLFAQIPTAGQLDQAATDTSHFAALVDDDRSSTTQPIVPLVATKALLHEIEAGRADSKMMDGHALSRLRMNDRHDAIVGLCKPSLHSVEPKRGTGSDCYAAVANTTNGTDAATTVATRTTTMTTTTNSLWTGTLRFEFLRQQVRRTSTPDSNRMVLEFLGRQTLLDVHRAIVELTHDELGSFDTLRQEQRQRSSEPATTTDNNCALPNDHSATSRETAATSFSSGFFFIEDTFYKTGPVDYTVTILEWLQSGNSNRERKRRCANLGLIDTGGPHSFVLPPVKEMSSQRLDEISCRLGIRYVHVHNGDVECAMFVTDRRLLPQAAAAADNQTQFPILHDLWSPSYTIPECDICQARPASVATSTTCEMTGGHVAVCETCCRQLELPTKAPDHIMSYTVWRGQADLSAGASGDVTW
jgi:snRNA-activating protein complex (SNAPc), subunit 3